MGFFAAGGFFVAGFAGVVGLVAVPVAGGLPATATNLYTRGMRHPASSAGANVHLPTAFFTLVGSHGCVLFTTVKVFMSALPSVSTSTSVRISAYLFLSSTPFGIFFES